MCQATSRRKAGWALPHRLRQRQRVGASAKDVSLSASFVFCCSCSSAKNFCSRHAKRLKRYQYIRRTDLRGNPRYSQPMGEANVGIFASTLPHHCLPTAATSCFAAARQSLTTGSVLLLTSVCLSDEKLTERTAPSPAFSAMTSCCVATSHSLTKPSELPVASRWPSGEKVKQLT